MGTKSIGSSVVLSGQSVCNSTSDTLSLLGCDTERDIRGIGEVLPSIWSLGDGIDTRGNCRRVRLVREGVCLLAPLNLKTIKNIRRRYLFE